MIEEVESPIEMVFENSIYKNKNVISGGLALNNEDSREFPDFLRQFVSIELD